MTEYFSIHSHLPQVQHLISVVIFTLPDTYKHQSRYTNGLKLLISQVPRLFPDFTLRIYHDDSIQLWKLPHYAHAVRFTCPKFLSNHPPYHEGLIGTFARFLPLFNDETFETLLIMDVDVDIRNIEETSKYLRYLHTNLSFLYGIRGCYGARGRFQVFNHLFDTRNPIRAWPIFSKIKFPNSLLSDFLHSVETQTGEVYKTFMEKGQTIHLKHQGRAPYGIDEAFLLLLKQYIDQNKIRYGVVILRQISRPLHAMIQRYESGELSEKKARRILKKVLGNKHYNATASVKDNFVTFDRTVHNHFLHPPSPLYAYFFNRLKALMRYLSTNNSLLHKYGFSHEEVECVLEQSLKLRTFIASSF